MNARQDIVRPTPGATARRIVDAAVALFYEQGYNATTLRQIAERVGLQVGSLYNHMASKEQLLFDITRTVMEDLIAFTEEQVAEAGADPVDRLVAFMRASIHFHGTRQQETFIGNTELRGLSAEHRAEVLARRDRYESRFGALLEEAEGAGAVAVDDLRLATFGGLAICTSVASWYRPGGRLPLEEIERRLPTTFGPLAQALDRRGVPSPR